MTAPALPPEERRLIDALRSAVERPPFQANDAFETDAELLDVGWPSLLAATVDTLHADSELATAPSPYARGWLVATAALSDLAAVGARPVGLLLSCSFPPGAVTDEAAREIGRGADAAARRQGARIVGGDTNLARDESMTGCALGLVERDAAMTRMGASAGDILCATGRVGAGNAAGVRALLGGDREDPWLPTARCEAGLVLNTHVRACIDTSDGLLSATLMLAELNGLGFELLDVPELYDQPGLELAARLGLPSWLLGAGEWGEYELLYAVAPDDEERCGEALARVGLAPVQVGRLTAEASCTILAGGGVGPAVDAHEIAARMRTLERGAGLEAELSALVEQLT